MRRVNLYIATENYFHKI